MKKVYLVSPFWEARPKAIFETKSDAEKFIKEFDAPNHQILEYVLWENAQDIKEIINPITGMDHAEYGKKYYGFYLYDQKSQKGVWSNGDPSEVK